MTNKEAVRRIREHMIVHKLNEPQAIKISEALDLAIKALEEYPTDKEIQDDMRRTYLGGKEE